MAFTDNSDLFASVHEDGINLFVRHIMRKRPSLFNYGTAMFLSDPSMLCEKIDADVDVYNFSNPLITVEPPLPVLGTNGAVGLNFCVQLTRLEIDFHPGNTINLPSELSPPLAGQRFSGHMQVCAGLGCPPAELLDHLDGLLDPGRSVFTHRQERPEKVVIPTRRLDCFCLDLFLVGRFEVTSSQMLRGRLEGLEVVDIKPEGLENSLECYLRLLIQLVVLPKASIAIQAVMFDLLNLATITLSASPTSAAIPNNPAVEDDQVKVFVDFGVTP